MKKAFNDKNDLWHLFINRMVEKAQNTTMEQFVCWFVDKFICRNTGDRKIHEEIAEDIGLKRSADMAKIYFRLTQMQIQFTLNPEYKF